jgi:uncharacterized cofD-like protein
MAEKYAKNIVILGGGTGTFTALLGLKKYPVNLTAIVGMSDSGGSTGMLRDELGVLPPGDVMRCLVALSSSSKQLRKLMDYRFEKGNLKGHKFGNLLLSALEKTSGSFESAIETASNILRINGTVLPVTLDPVHLMAQVGNRIVRGEETIQQTKLNGSLRHMWLEPVGRPNPKALAALRAADIIVIGPGNFYASLVTNLLVHRIPETIRKSKAKKIFVCNLMTKVEHTKNYTVADYTAAIEKYLGGPVDVVLYNNKVPAQTLLKKYAREGDTLTAWDKLPEGRVLVGADLLSKAPAPFTKIGTPSKESSLVRHDPTRLAAEIAKLAGVRKSK